MDRHLLRILAGPHHRNIDPVCVPISLPITSSITLHEGPPPPGRPYRGEVPYGPPPYGPPPRSYRPWGGLTPPPPDYFRDSIGYDEYHGRSKRDREDRLDSLHADRYKRRRSMSPRRPAGGRRRRYVSLWFAFFSNVVLQLSLPLPVSNAISTPKKLAFSFTETEGTLEDFYFPDWRQ